METKITIGILMLLLAAGFVITSYDDCDDGVKIMSEDDYIDLEIYGEYPIQQNQEEVINYCYESTKLTNRRNQQ